jgi:hypothetical protein
MKRNIEYDAYDAMEYETDEVGTNNTDMEYETDQAETNQRFEVEEMKKHIREYYKTHENFPRLCDFSACSSQNSTEQPLLYEEIKRIKNDLSLNKNTKPSAEIDDFEMGFDMR